MSIPNRYKPLIQNLDKEDKNKLFFKLNRICHNWNPKKAIPHLLKMHLDNYKTAITNSNNNLVVNNEDLLIIDSNIINSVIEIICYFGKGSFIPNNIEDNLFEMIQYTRGFVYNVQNIKDLKVLEGEKQEELELLELKKELYFFATNTLYKSNYCLDVLKDSFRLCKFLNFIDPNKYKDYVDDKTLMTLVVGREFFPKMYLDSPLNTPYIQLRKNYNPKRDEKILEKHIINFDVLSEKIIKEIKTKGEKAYFIDNTVFVGSVCSKALFSKIFIEFGDDKKSDKHFVDIIHILIALNYIIFDKDQDENIVGEYWKILLKVSFSALLS